MRQVIIVAEAEEVIGIMENAPAAYLNGSTQLATKNIVKDKNNNNNSNNLIPSMSQQLKSHQLKARNLNILKISPVEREAKQR